MKVMTVLLDCGTVGTIENAIVGKIATVKLQDENGNFIEKTGVVMDILEEYDPWIKLNN